MLNRKELLKRSDEYLGIDPSNQEARALLSYALDLFANLSISIHNHSIESSLENDPINLLQSSEHIYYLYNLFLKRIESSGIIDNPRGTSSRTKLFIILRDIFLAQIPPEKRQEKIRNLLELLCLYEGTAYNE